MTAPQAPPVPVVVARRDLRPGPLLAEGGEGRVFELPDRPGVLYKEHRRPLHGDGLQRIVAWPAALADAQLRSRLTAATAWPSAVVTDGPATVGLLMPRAPRRFSVRHRDGVARLATLSYLTADPARRSAAYGLALPAQGDPQRIAVVYALARVLEAMEAGDPHVVHGDLSAKNVLWSTAQGPQVFLLDLDNGELHGADGTPAGADDRRRAMTPNWHDPTVEGNPGPFTDRYSLGLIFLRLVGAAHFPLQKRQAAGEAVDVELDVPAGLLRAPSLGPDAPIWGVASRSLSVADPAARPPASTWAAALDDVLVDLGARALRDAVHRAQGSSAPSIPAQPVAGPAAPDVAVRPRAARPRSQAWARTTITAGPVGPGRAAITGRAGPAPGRPSGGVATGVPLGPVRVVTQPPPPVTAAARAALAQAVVQWAGMHQRTYRRIRTGQGGAARRVAALAFIDFALACVGLLLVAMLVSPFLGI
ncbi:MAG TPA: hypothetical protein VFP61_13215 [Acidimicrobiales bacterium]|nr:hypothetical protein [Acidimicrobiales bacterium]